MVVAKYKFNPSTYSDYLPEFNSGFSYTKSDTTNSDGTITRTIESNSLPTSMRFGERVNASDRSRSLLEILSMNTSNITDMSYMFRYCENLTSVICDWNTSQATTMSHMFANCSNLLQLDVSKWNLSKVKQMQYIFGMCISLSSLNVSNWDTSQVTNMEGVFNNCSSLTSLDVSNWNTSKVTDMGYMFDNFSSLISLDLSNWDTSKVTSMQGMFRKCLFTSLDLTKWDTCRVTNMNAMFWNSSQLTSLDLSSFNTSKVTNMSYMFTKCSSLTTLNLSNWDTSQVTDISNILSDCSALYKINLKYANQSTVSKIHENLPNRTSTTKGYILSPVDFTSNKNWQIIKSSHNNFYLPQPLNKIGDVKDRLYWDENKGHYCIEQMITKINISDYDWWQLESSKDGYDTFILGDFNKGTIYFPTVWGGRIIVSDDSVITLDTVHLRMKYPSSRFNGDVEKFKEYCLSNGVYALLQRYGTNKAITIDLPYLNQKLTFDSYNPSTTIDIPNRPLKASKTYLDAPIARYRYTGLQPSTQYNVQFDCKGDSGIKVNLGGTEVTFTPTSEWTRKNLTITTPSELVNDKLSISNVGITSNNKVDNVMLFSEVIAQEPDYIDGIQSIGELQSNGAYKINILTHNGVKNLVNTNPNNWIEKDSDSIIVKSSIKTEKGKAYTVFNSTGQWVAIYESDLDGNQYNLIKQDNISNWSFIATSEYIKVSLWGISHISDKLSQPHNMNVRIFEGYNDYGYNGYEERKLSTHSIYLPQPLRKRGNAKDKFYWDDDKGHYCIEQNISDNLEVLSSPNIIDLTEMNQKFSFDTYLPNTSVDVTNLPLQPYKLQLEDDTVRYKCAIAPSTLYTIQFNCVSKLTTLLTLDLGGSRVTVDPIIGVNHVQITTPSELTSDRLFLIGTGIVVKEVIVNKGNMNQYTKYFDGEQSVGELQEDGSYIIRISTDNYTNLWEGDL